MSDWVTVAKRGAKKNVEAEVGHDDTVAGSLVDLKAAATPLILVVDSAAIIKGLQLGSAQIDLYTVPEVLDEVRDKKARHLLDSMPFELKTREPSSEHISAGAHARSDVESCVVADAFVTTVIAFAKKTGDFRWLSVADVKVLALTRMFEVERNGSGALRSTPQPVSGNLRYLFV
jgi:RNA-binding protein NOB1